MLLMLPASAHRPNPTPKPQRTPEARRERPVPADPKFRRWLSSVWKRRWVKRIAVLSVIVLCVLASRRPKLPGVLGSVAADAHVGMSRDDVANLIRRSYAARESDDCPRLYTYGNRHNGQPLGAYFDWQLATLPPSEEIASGEFDVDDDQGRDLIISFGPGGTVTAVRLKSDSLWEQLRHNLARGTGWGGFLKRFAD